MKKFFQKLNKIIKSSILCIKYPFLYPRNRFDDTHHTYILNNLLYKIRKKAIISFMIQRKELTDKDIYHSLYYFAEYQISLLKDLNKIVIKSPIDIKEINLSEFMNVDDYIIKGLDVQFLIMGTPIIRLYTVSKNNIYTINSKQVDLILNRKYKLLYNLLDWFNNFLDKIFILPTYTEWDAVPEGWRIAFGDQYLRDLKNQLKKDGMLYSWRILQIKEKFGTLRLYCNMGSEDLYKLIDKYEDLSWNTCINCGKPATKISNGWISPYCDNCFPETSEIYQQKIKNKWEVNDDFSY